jgi:hypothetical protein
VPESRDRIEVVTKKGAVFEISMASRDAIVAELHRHNDEGLSWSALDAFERAGVRGPVQLGGRSGVSVFSAIGSLTERAGGDAHLEPEVGKLQRRLEKEMRIEWAEREAPFSKTEGWILLVAGFLLAARSVSKRNRREWP